MLFFLLFALLSQGQVELGFFVVGVQAQGLFEGIDAFIQFIQLKISVAQVVVGCGFIGRICRFFRRVFITGEGFLVAFLLINGIAKVVLALGAIFALEGFAVIAFRVGITLLQVFLVSFAQPLVRCLSQQAICQSQK